MYININSLPLEEQERLYHYLKQKFEINSFSSSSAKKYNNVHDLDINLKDLNLYERACNLLNSKGIFTVRELLKFRPSQLLKIKGFGNRCIKETEYTLTQMGKELKKNIIR